MHICTVLQHLISAHDPEACAALLRYNAPFVLLRALDKPGCAELLLGLLAGCEVPLPALNTGGAALRPISPPVLKQVLQYVQSSAFPGLIAALLDQGARRGEGGGGGGGGRVPGSPAPPRTPAGRRSWPSPCDTPGPHGTPGVGPHGTPGAGSAAAGSTPRRYS